MLRQLIPIALPVGVFLGLLVCLRVGHLLGLRHARSGTADEDGSGLIGAGILALLGLLLAFAFAGGMSRLDVRRELVVREANVIGSAYPLLDVLPPADQKGLRRLFRDYTSARVRAYEVLPDVRETERQIAIAKQIYGDIWTKAVAASRQDPTGKTMILVLPKVNEMTDVATARTVALRTHLPPLLFFLLIGVALLSGLIAGYDMGVRKTRGRLHAFIFAATVSITIYAIIDLDFPGYGLIQLRAAENALVDLRDSMR